MKLLIMLVKFQCFSSTSNILEGVVFETVLKVSC